MTLDPAAGDALYRQLAARLRDAIRAGDLPPGARLPSEQELRDAYDVSRTTVRLAIGVLRSEGFVVTGQGRGSFVADPLPQEPRVTTEDGAGAEPLSGRDDLVMEELHVIREELRQLNARLDQLAAAGDDAP